MSENRIYYEYIEDSYKNRTFVALFRKGNDWSRNIFGLVSELEDAYFFNSMELEETRLLRGGGKTTIGKLTEQEQIKLRLKGII